MGAMVTVKYDDPITDDEATRLAEGTRAVIGDAIGEDDVFVYAHKAPITVAVEPIELFVQVNARKITNPEELMESIAQKLTTWKQENDFKQPINLNVIPVAWHSKVGI